MFDVLGSALLVINSELSKKKKVKQMAGIFVDSANFRSLLNFAKVAKIRNPCEIDKVAIASFFWFFFFSSGSAFAFLCFEALNCY